MALSVTIIGTGNIAWHFAKRLSQTDIKIEGVASRQRLKAQHFIEELDLACEIVEAKSQIGSNYTIFCVGDNVLVETIEKYKYGPKNLILHTSGSTGLSAFPEPLKPQAGVVYPFQTLTYGKEFPFQDVPLFLEVHDESKRESLKQLAATLSNHSTFMTSQARLKIHLAGVYASNFTNFILWYAQKHLDEAHLKLGLVQNLVEETVKKAFEIGPEKAQTGPARRGDTQTISRHLSQISSAEEKEIYRLISNEIFQNLGFSEE